MAKRIISLVTLSLLPFAPPVLAQQAGPSGGDETRVEQELAEVTQQIAAVEAQARTVDDVQAKTETFREVVSKEMIREEPELRAEIERQGELVEELASIPPGDPKRAERMEEFRELRRKLLPVEQRVQQNGEVIKAREAYSKSLVAEMEKIDPEILAKFERRKTLTAELRQSAPR
jgi:hypothetical protein